MAGEHLLILEGVTVRFGGLVAAQNVTLSVAEGAIGAVIGPNGAGKTTVFNCITGIYTPSSGKVSISGLDIRKPFSTRLVLRTAAIALAGGVTALLAVTIQELWEAGINQLFIFGQPFDWGASFRATSTTLASLPAIQTWGTLVLGAFVSAASYLTLWSTSRHTPHSTLARGIARTFQNIRLFKSMTALENILVGLESRQRYGAMQAILRPARYRNKEAENLSRARELLSFVGLEGIEDTPATALPYGYQRRLEIARALATEPKVLLLDEPAAGMNGTEITDLMSLIKRIQERGVTVLLIEHHMQLVMGISHHITVLEYGQKIAEGSPDDIRSNPRVIAAYLGEIRHDS